MPFATWWKKYRRSARPTTRRGKPVFRKCFLEILEDRTLLSASTYTVDLPGDAGNADPNNPLAGDIRYCINQANIPANAGSTITFDPQAIGNGGVITLTSGIGELQISNNMTITNSTLGAITINGTIASGAASRVFNITSPQATVTMVGLVITGGNASPLQSFTPGNQGGDIFNGGTLYMQNDIVQNGLSQGNIGGPVGRGGGIFNAESQPSLNTGAKLTLDNTIVQNNTAKGITTTYPGGEADGGGIYNDIFATVTFTNGSQVLNNTALATNGNNGPNGGGNGGPGIRGGDGGIAKGGGILSNGNLVFKGTAANPIIISTNVAQGGNSGNGGNGANATKAGTVGGRGGDGGTAGSAAGGGLYNDGNSFVLTFVQFTGNQAISGNSGHGGNGGAGNVDSGGHGGSGGDTLVAQGGGLFNASGTVTITGGSFTGNQAISGNTGYGGNGGAGNKNNAMGGFPGGDAGAGGNVGAAQGGSVFNSTAGGAVSFTNVSVAASLAQAGSAGYGGTGGVGGNSSAIRGGRGGAGGASGTGGIAQGGAVYNSGGDLSFSNYVSQNSQAKGSSGNVGGTGGTGGNGTASFVRGGTGGAGGKGGAGGAAQGGGFYNVGGTLTLSNAQFIADINGLSNTVTSGSGNTGGNGGNGGAGDKAQGGAGGIGARGGDAGLTEGGAGVNGGGDATINGSTFTGDMVTSGTGGNGGNGGNGGPGTVPGTEGDGGDAGNAGTARGGALSVVTGALTIGTSAFGGSAALADQVIGAIGGTGGHAGTGLGTGLHGSGGGGGQGSTVSGGALSVNTPAPVHVLSGYPGIDFNSSGGVGTPPNEPPYASGAAGTSATAATNVYIETTNSAIAIYTPEATGATVVRDTLNNFFTNTGKLPPEPGGAGLFSDPTTVWDEQIQRFIVMDQNYDFFNANDNVMDIAISTSANPSDLTANNWKFFQVNTAEAGFTGQFTGNMGWNAGALVFTQNMVPTAGGLAHSQVVAIPINNLLGLPTGTILLNGATVFQTDVNAFSLQPTVMHDSAAANDPMWFVAEGGDNQSINVIEMTNVLSALPIFTATNLSVTPYSTAVAQLQPNGQPIVSQIDSRFQKAAMQGGMLVTSHTVSDAAGDLDQIQWYEIDTTAAGGPSLVQQGDVNGGPGTYDAYSSMDINANGDLGMTFMSSGTAPGQFLSMYITGRLASDPAGTMNTPVLVQAGQANYVVTLRGLSEIRQGNLSGINVDPRDGSFWAVNEYTNNETGANWGTFVAHFAVEPVGLESVAISNSSFDNNVISAGAGGAGGQSGVNGGTAGSGGNSGDAFGGGVALSSFSQTATMTKVDISNNSASTAAGGGPGAVQAGTPSGNGGNGGNVQGAGLSSTNFNLTVSNATMNGNVGTAGIGGNGGSQTLAVSTSGTGGDAGNGGSASGGSIAFVNNLPTTLSLTVSNSTGLNNQLIGGQGGRGGDAGTTGHDHVTGGGGGVGGSVQGGGISIQAGIFSVNNTSISNMSLIGEQLKAGSGGVGGAGSSATAGANPGAFAKGGDGGDALGGGIADSSLNTTTISTVQISGSTMAGNQLIAGNGAIGGTGTTANGGPGGNGGDGGNALGGGFYAGNQTFVNYVINSTIGGLNTDLANPNLYSNTLAAGSGGGGNNAGTPTGVDFTNGGNGGNAGNAEGGGVYIFANNTATFVNNTIVNNQAAIIGKGGAPGSGAGTGGQSGTRGADGVGSGGGYFAGAGSTNQVGNSILDLNTAATTGANVDGVFISGLPGNPNGNNILGDATGSTGFDAAFGDQIGVDQTTLNIGPLLNNGGSNLTAALLSNANGTSAAIDKGNSALVTNALFGAAPTDERGSSFPRIVNSSVDVGAFELQPPPSITSLNPNTIVEGTAAFNLTITGSGFEPGSTVTIDGVTFTPLPGDITSTQIKITVNKPLPDLGAVNVTVGNPDGSGIAGETINSAPATFTITQAPLTIPNPGNQSSNEGNQISLPVTATPASSAVYSATGLPTGLSIDPTTSVISGKIDPRGEGTYNVTVTVTRGAASANASFTWTVADTTPPAITNPNTQNSNIGDTVSLPITVTDADSGTISATGLPPGLSIDSTSGLITGIISVNGAGTYQPIISASDNGHAAQITFTWNVSGTVANPVTITNPGTQNSSEGQNISLQIQATNADTYSATGLPGGLSINTSTGLISGTINGNAAGTFTVTVKASKGTASAAVTFSWNVAATAPVFTNPGTQNNKTGDTVSLPISAANANPGTFTASGLPAGLSINATTGVISGTISGNAAGTYTVTVGASNGGIPSSTQFTWVVTNSSSGGGGGGGGSNGGGGSTSGSSGTPSHIVITGVTNTYAGLWQIETVAALVTDAAGNPVDTGIVTFQVNGQSIAAQVQHGHASVTFSTPLISFDFTILMSDFFAHTLDAVYSDPSGIFGSLGASTSVPPMLLDFLFFLFSTEPQLLLQGMG